MNIFRSLRLASPLIGAAALLASGLAVGAEVTGLIDGRWRHDLASGMSAVLNPGWTPWQQALAGAGLAMAAIVFLASEFTRPSRGTRIMYPVHATNDGNTQITGKAATHAARRQLDDIEGIVDASATTTKSAMTVTIRVDDRTDLATVEHQVRERLDHEFWIDLGLADFALNLFITHHPKPPRVR